MAATLARFHADAPQGVAPDPFATQLDACLHELAARTGSSEARRLRTAIARLHETCHAELSQRQRGGLTRDCHGDLRAEHVVMREPPEIFDCIEFDPHLRQIDVGADLAFLVMDLERLGRGDLGQHLVSAYRAEGGDPGSPRLLALFCAYRACVRALVAEVRAEQGSGGDAAVRERDGLMLLAWRFVWRSHLPLVLVVCGPAAVGKTTLAAEIAALSGVPHLNSDVTRKQLAGIPLTARGDDALYTDEMSRRVYGRLADDAKRSPEGAVVDATFRRARDRATFLAALAPASAVFVECTAPEAVIAERASTRAQIPGHVSDADASRAIEQARSFHALTEIAPDDHFAVSVDGPPQALTQAVEAWLAERARFRACDPAELRTPA